MGFTVYTSHAYSALVDTLCRRLVEETRSENLRETVVVVPNHMIANWLSNRIADRLGICLNIRFTYLDSLFAARPQGDFAGLADNCRLVWALDILAAIESQEIRFPFDLENTGDVVPAQYAWELAGQLRKYAEYRRPWLNEWAAGSGVTTQQLHRQCWEVICRAGHSEHEPLIAAENHLVNAGPPFQAESLHVFGFWEISPIKWKLLEALFENTQIHAYLSFPSATFLVDLTRSNLRQPFFSDSEDALLNPRLRLLSRLSARGRAFQAFLLDENTHSEQLQTSLPENRTLLESLQRLLIEPETISAKKRSYSPTDFSIQIHSCTTRKREVEVVKAQIQQALLSDPSLRLEDIHVYAPDIGEYAQWIPAVFSEKEPHYELAYSIRESLDPDRIPVFRTLLSLIEIHSTAWPAKAIQDLLMSESIRLQYGLQTSDVERIGTWISSANIVSGIEAGEINDATQPDRYYTWAEGLNRMIQRYAAEPGNPFESRHAPSPTDDPETFDAFLRFIRDLQGAGAELRAAEYRPNDIVDVLRRIVNTFIPKDFHTYEQSVLQKTLAEIEDALSGYPASEFSLSALTFLLRKTLPRLPLPTALNRKSGIQFSSIRYEEMVPGKLKLIMGLSEGIFPRNDPQRSHDLMQAEPARFEDPSKRDADLYWLLHSIIHAEQQWVATYLGQDEFSNESRPASNALQAILETINTVISGEYADAPEPLLSAVTQPRFPYEDACFGDDALITHFDRSCYLAAKRVRNPEEVFEFSRPKTSATAHESRDCETTSVADLIRFYTHPARYYCREVLDLSLSKGGVDEPDHEPLLWSSDSLQDYKKMQVCLRAVMMDLAGQDVRVRLIEENLLPIGSGGDLEFERLWEESLGIVNEWSDKLHLCIDPQEVESVSRPIGSYTLQTPRLRRYYPAIGFVLPGNLKKKHEIEAWIYSLGLWLNCDTGERFPVTLIGKGKPVVFQPPDNPEQIFLELLELKAEYASDPLPFFPETSFAAYRNNPDPDTLLQHTKWNGYESPGERDDPFNRLMIPASGNPFTLDFYEIAKRFYALMEAAPSEPVDTQAR